eukprot:SAG11_NODE_544_length_8629_cov_3.550229_2_plen_76_part_00
MGETQHDSGTLRFRLVSGVWVSGEAIRLDGREVTFNLWVIAPVRGRYKYVPLSAKSATGVAVVKGMGTPSATYLL